MGRPWPHLPVPITWPTLGQYDVLGYSAGRRSGTKQANGVFFRNSHIRIKDVTDGRQQDDLYGEKRRQISQRFHLGGHRAGA